MATIFRELSDHPSYNLYREHNQVLAQTTKTGLSRHDWKIIDWDVKHKITPRCYRHELTLIQSILSSTAYTQVNCILDFIMGANNLKPD